MNQRVHLIAIGGSIMHNLALALHSQGFIVSGSDDQIYEPARSRLQNRGICPEKEGWYPDKINNDLSFVVLGMHAKSDNPELIRAQEIGLKLYSFPEFVAILYRDSFKIVVAGSHGKTTTTSMLMHVFKSLQIEFDYLVGAQLEGFNEMVSINHAKYTIIEGDEYLSSCLDSRPKFLHYNPELVIITGIAWDHYNVFPTFELYKESFVSLLQSMRQNSVLIWYSGDPDLEEIVSKHGSHLNCISYQEPEYIIRQNKSFLVNEEACYSLEIFGKHNLQNMNSVIQVCKYLQLDLIQTCLSLSSFKGAAKRLQILFKNDQITIFQDFAHAPSKVKATIQALRETFKNQTIKCFLELHTYSSLNHNFLPQYYNTCGDCNTLNIYYDPKALEIKGMQALDENFIKQCFGRSDINIITNSHQLEHEIQESLKEEGIIAFLGSGNWGGVSLY
ncbi:MAG: peptidoglycan synthetase [Saprospiraceae bacterium]|nr:peptidoglycan synthetase [Saprospiraceae bacterium]